MLAWRRNVSEPGGKVLTKFPALALVVTCAALLGHACDSTLQQTPGPVTPKSPALAEPTYPSQKQTEAGQSVTGRTIWSGINGGLDIRWTTDDLFVQSGNGYERIWAPLAKKGFEEFAADVARTNSAEGGTANNCDYKRDFQILSIVGTLISFQDEEYSDCGGLHPSTYRRFTAVDVSRPGEILYGQREEAMDADLKRSSKIVKLTDYFNEQHIVNALSADRVIQQALTEAGVSGPPPSLAALPELFAKNNYILSGTELELRPDFLTRFAFHHIEDGKVAVRINLPSLSAAYRAQQIGLLLPIPPSLQQPFDMAVTGRGGFLLREMPRTARNQFTRFGFKIGEGAKHPG